MTSTIKYSHTLWSPSDTVKDVAETLGIANLPDEVAKTLAMDIEYRIHEVVEQALKFMRHSKRSTLTTPDISEALKVLNVEPLYGYESTRPLHYREALVGPGQTLYYIDDDDDVDFEKIINQPLPKVPRQVSFTAHWLAIEGVQPAIPQNPHMSEIKNIPPQLRGSQAQNSVAALSSEVDVKPLVKHVISRELQLYFDKTAAALISPNPADSHLRKAALTSLSNDPGLHQLVPYFVQFVQEKVSSNLKSSLDILTTMLEIVYALLTNPSLFIEPYIHHIMPSILTPLLAKRVGPKPVTDGSYPLRDYAAALLKRICETYGDTYATLKPRITRTLLKGFLDISRPVGALYGSIIGLQALGPEIVRVVLVGNLSVWVENVFPKITKEEDRAILIKAIIEALRTLETQTPPLSELTNIDADKLRNVLGIEVTSKLELEADGKAIAYAVLHGV
jgi:transcription initiation factor TFIID subunit 6